MTWTDDGHYVERPVASPQASYLRYIENMAPEEQKAARAKGERIEREGFGFLRGERPATCTPRCASLHALDCPNYSGPLSRTGSLESAPHWSDTTGQTW